MRVERNSAGPSIPKAATKAAPSHESGKGPQVRQTRYDYLMTLVRVATLLLRAGGLRLTTGSW